MSLYAYQTTWRRRAIALIDPRAEADNKMAENIQKGMRFAEASDKHKSGLSKPQ